MLVFFAITWAVFVVCIISVFNIGTLVGERMRMQHIADNAAYSGAVWESRCLNYIAYCNRGIVADIAFLAYLTAADSHLQAWRDLVGWLARVPYVGYVARIVSPVINFLWRIVKMIKESRMLEYSILKFSTAQRLYNTYSNHYLHSVMSQVVAECGFNASFNSSMVYGMNRNNHNNVVQNGNGQDLQYVAWETSSPWSQGRQSGTTPLKNRSYQALRRTLPPFFFPANAGIKGYLYFTPDGIHSQDLPYIVYWRFKRFRLRKRTSYLSNRRSFHPISWTRIPFYQYKRSPYSRWGWWWWRRFRGNSGVGIYAVVDKPVSRMNSMLFMQFLRAPFGATHANMFTVPRHATMRTKAKAAARYEDPAPFSSRQLTLSSMDKEPNLFNPFWHAELVALEGNTREDAYPYMANYIIGGDYALKRH
jgi:hypothetical protein